MNDIKHFYLRYDLTFLFYVLEDYIYLDGTGK